jgi:opacity protein-like surface antigen
MFKLGKKQNESSKEIFTMKVFLQTAMVVIVGLIITASSAIAQGDEFNKAEGFVGYSYMQLHRGLDAEEFVNDVGDFPSNRVGAHGFNGSGTYNFTRYVGAKFDFTYHKHRQNFDAVPVVNPLGSGSFGYALDQQAIQYMGGIQIKDNSKDGPKFKPFAHFLAGAASQSIQLEQTGQDQEIVPFDVNNTSFAMKIGGGIDYKVHKNIDIRLIQFDWNPIWRGEQNFGPTIGTLPAIAQQNLQFTFGVVFH